MFKGLLTTPIALLATVLGLTGLTAACSQSADPAQIAALAAVQQGATLIDVRSVAEFSGGHLPGALNIVHTEIVAGAAKAGLTQDTDIVVYCRTGNRSGAAKASLEAAGFSRVTNAGAYDDLLRAKAALEAAGS